MVRSLILTALCVCTSTGSLAQEKESSLKERLFENGIAPIDTIGVRRFVEEVSSGRTDSAEVYFDKSGEPSAWRAWVDGSYYVYWEPYGRFEVTDSALVALEVYKKHRRLLEMLEGLELVERAAKSAP